MEIKIDEQAVRDVVTKSIMDQLGEDARETMISAALAYLLDPKKDGFNKGISPIQEAFNNAIGQAARTIVFDLVENDPDIRQKIVILVGEAFIQMESTNFTEYLAAALSDALRRGR